MYEVSTLPREDAPIILLLICLGITLFAYRRWILRQWNWYVFYSIQRYYHRLRKRYRHLKAGMMAKWKKGIVADILHDALFEAVNQKVLSQQEYRRYMKLVGKALDVTDLVPRPRHIEGIRKQVTDAIKASKTARESSDNKLPEVLDTGTEIRIKYLQRHKDVA